MLCRVSWGPGHIQNACRCESRRRGDPIMPHLWLRKGTPSFLCHQLSHLPDGAKALGGPGCGSCCLAYFIDDFHFSIYLQTTFSKCHTTRFVTVRAVGSGSARICGSENNPCGRYVLQFIFPPWRTDISEVVEENKEE